LKKPALISKSRIKGQIKMIIREDLMLTFAASKRLTIAPNRPVTLALQDPEGRFDFETGMGQYQTTAGELVTLPRPAVVILNTLDPQPGEQIVICKHWSGRPGEKAEWTISLSPKSENTRAEAEKEPADLTGLLQASIEAVQARKAAIAPPTPIRRPAKRPPAPDIQPRLFDRGTGTHGPAPAAIPLSIPLPAVAIGRQPRPGQIPANIAVREILAFIKADPSTANWDAQSIQDLCSTAYIAAVKQGWVGLWERS
jgi:hypothetical protein